MNRRFLFLLVILPFLANADDGAPDALRDEAWFTGSLNSTGATALPAGHFLAEPYLLGESHTADSLNLLLYGVTDDFTIGLIPRFSWRDHIEPGDLTTRLQYRFTAYDEVSGMPSIAVVLNETFPTGKYDNLNLAGTNGDGNGTYLTQFGLLTDEYVTIAGRPLRLRFDLSYGVSTSMGLQNRSVYGTPMGFAGHARPGAVYDATLAFEYSLSTRWALALDASYDRSDRTRINGGDFHAVSKMGQSANLVPAVEYNFTALTGLIVGVQLPVWQRNVPRIVVPIAALNCVF